MDTHDQPVASAAADAIAPDRTPKPRGFAAMDRERQAAIARKGGQAAHAKGTAHEFTGAEAVAAGRKGGQSVSKNTAHMREIGRKGGLSRGKLAKLAKEQVKEPTATSSAPV